MDRFFSPYHNIVFSWFLKLHVPFLWKNLRRTDRCQNVRLYFVHLFLLQVTVIVHKERKQMTAKAAAACFLSGIKERPTTPVPRSIMTNPGVHWMRSSTNTVLNQTRTNGRIVVSNQISVWGRLLRYSKTSNIDKERTRQRQKSIYVVF